MIKLNRVRRSLRSSTRRNLPARILWFLAARARRSWMATTLLSLTIAPRAYADMPAPALPQSFDQTSAFSLTLAAVFFACAISTAGLWFLRNRASKPPLIIRLLLSATVVLLIAFLFQLNSGLPSDFVYNALATESAAKWPKAYTATFECRTEDYSTHVTEYKQYSNGQGLVSCGFEDGSNDRCVYDLVRHQIISIHAGKKTYTIGRSYSPLLFDQASALAAKLQPTGVRNIDGHPCHGWLQVGTEGDRWSNIETWIGDDTQCEVECTTKRINTVTKRIKLKKYSAEKSPEPVFFQPPQGYTLKKQ
jgi:hypothetical protein